MLVRFQLDPPSTYGEMADAPRLGRGGGNPVEVRVLLCAPRFYRTMDSTLPCEGRNSGSTPDKITRTVGGVAYLTALLKQRSREGTVGSNPTLSALKSFPAKIETGYSIFV